MLRKFLIIFQLSSCLMTKAWPQLLPDCWRSLRPVRLATLAHRTTG